MIQDIVQAGVEHASVMEALHQDGFDVPWSEQSFMDLLAQPNINGWIAAADEAEVLTLAVGASHRRQGLARSLMLYVLRSLKENAVKLWHLEVADDNGAAIALYQSLGFSESGRRAGYYLRPNGHADAVLMTKQVNDFRSTSD